MRPILFFLGVFGFSAAAPLCGQEFRGRIYDADSRAFVAGVTIYIREAPSRSLVASFTADSTGAFVARLPRAGKYLIQTHQLGYSQSTSQVLEVTADEVVEIELVLSVRPLTVEPVNVTARSQPHNPYLEASGFYARRESGVGHFLTRAEVQRYSRVQVSESLRHVPGVRMVRVDGRRFDAMISRASYARRCLPAIFLDGVLSRPGGPQKPTDVALDDLVPATEIEGIEIYSGPSQSPSAFSRYADCGVIVIWTKRRI